MRKDEEMNLLRRVAELEVLCRVLEGQLQAEQARSTQQGRMLQQLLDRQGELLRLVWLDRRKGWPDVPSPRAEQDEEQ
jgi:hypothetical protein